MKNYLLLEEEIKQVTRINNIITLLYWDLSTCMPVNAGTSRGEDIATLTTIVYDILRSDKIFDLIARAKEEIPQLDQWQTANLALIEKKAIESRCIDYSLQKKYILAATQGELVWRQAKKENNYELFKPYLQQILTCVKEIASTKSKILNCTMYDSLIDIYDCGRKVTEIKEIFSAIKKTIPNLIHKIVEKQRKEVILPITNKVSIAKQEQICKRIMQILGFDFTKGRLDQSAHPFCRGMFDDIRLTTRYNEDNFLTGIEATIHETGHALYEQDFIPKYRHQFVGQKRNMSLHESQSLLMEMQVGRSQEFVEFFAMILRDEFDFKGQEYSSDNLYKILNRVNPSLIRVYADEVTYPMHVILRFELEEALINGDITLDELPAYWNDGMKKYLGISPTSNSVGCMQDIHWSAGKFGYFPTYTIGAIIASMIMRTIKSIYPNINSDFAVGRFDNLHKFLNQNIRCFASLYKTDELVKHVTLEDKVNPQIFSEYIENKYLN
ncbi:carboxypeptidase M32 [Orientia tsutsugamushi]|uniref:Metal-dependent carboxypeptidase n=1 Tax=Orientia tsutsugamushi TaxID=784 RepID=A0A2U3RT74_ORITS|nr:carboxypeptidase M32 [Orientia tsutsugamushi]KJV54644.1 carboxypeptidase Taq (M32) metallopeptidase family protein [Orientia tsutsugamushi str. Karp]SPR16410.1 carboxypeptidase M32 [Orientia tsutsugamushi]